MSGDGMYAPPQKGVRSFALRQSDENDRQAEALKALADVLAGAEHAKNWDAVASVQVALRCIAKGLEAKDEEV